MLGLCRFMGLPRIELSSTLLLATAGGMAPACEVVAAASLLIGEGSRPRAPTGAFVVSLAVEPASGSEECALLSCRQNRGQ